MRSPSYNTNPNCPSILQSAVFCNASPDASIANGDAVATSGKNTLTSAGITGGIEAGHNWQMGKLVLDTEADFDGMHLNKSHSANGTFPFAFPRTTYNVKNSFSTDWLATVRGRIGTTITSNLLLYVTGGAAFADYKTTSSYQDNAVGFDLLGGSGQGSDSGVKLG